MDQVIFALWQVTPKDMSYIQEQLQSPEGTTFEVRDFTEECWGAPSTKRQPGESRMTGTVYVKVDDDVVYIAEHAIANLVTGQEEIAGTLFVGFCQRGKSCHYVCRSSKAWSSPRVLAQRRAAEESFHAIALEEDRRDQSISRVRH